MEELWLIFTKRGRTVCGRRYDDTGISIPGAGQAADIRDDNGDRSSERNSLRFDYVNDFIIKERICGHGDWPKNETDLGGVAGFVQRVQNRSVWREWPPLFLCGQHILGAARHQGFIPWDDDIDVAMLQGRLRPLFAAPVLELCLKPYMNQQTNETDSVFFRGWYAYGNSDTTGVEIQDVERFCNWGIWIDILALITFYKWWSEAEGTVPKDRITNVYVCFRLNEILGISEGLNGRKGQHIAWL